MYIKYAFFVHIFLKKTGIFKTEFAIFIKKGILGENFDFYTKKKTHKENVFWKNFDFIQKKKFFGEILYKKGTKTNCQKGTKKGTRTKKAYLVYITV